VAAIDRSHGKQTSVIVCDPSILEGEPTVGGTRIPVRSIVLVARELGGVDGARRAYPQLDVRAVQDALAYYEAHRPEVDRYIEENARTTEWPRLRSISTNASTSPG